MLSNAITMPAQQCWGPSHAVSVKVIHQIRNFVSKENCDDDDDNPKYTKEHPGQYKTYENDCTIPVETAKPALHIN